ncbi:type VI secretion system Vgr family protein [Sorangium sp. So ce1389]|uniref:type VI secretion system Vgr family protein n=1 Tax=Sorangium sp. So ce1389 TaxID=3133336 RepID=UPI003F61BB48
MDPFTLRCDAISGSPRVLGFRSREELGRCFEYDVCFTLDGSDVEVSFERVLGRPAALRIGTGDGAAEVQGHVAEIELLEDELSPMLRLRIVPALWFLRKSSHNRVFVDRPFPEILEDVLAEAGIGADAFALRLTAAYPNREHVCQYQESDLDFLQRWLEREGIYYFFDHGDGDSKLTFCDAPRHHAPARAEPVPYHPVTSADESSGQHFSVFHASLRALPHGVTEADYNYLTPAATIRATRDVAPELSASVQLWAENEADQRGAERLAGLRAELEQSRRRRCRAVGRELLIHAGRTFRLDRHPADELNREYLAVRVVRLGQINERSGRVVSFFAPDEAAALGREIVWTEVEAIPSEVQFRPPRSTPWPLAGGLELGVIDGAADSEYAQLDAHGRYLVRLMMDESASPDGRASMRLRMVQPHGGAQEGYHLPLRKGTEVLIAFLGGDPDRPVIAGAVPNALTPSPVTRANNTKNVVQTGGRSRLEVEDRDGQQYIDVSTPPEKTFVHLGAHAGLGDHNMVLSTSGDGLIRTGTNRDITVGGVQSEDVKGDLTETYHANQTTHVAGAFQETIESGAQQTVHAGLTRTITGGHQQSIDGGEQRSVSGGTTETINGSRTQTIVGSTTESISGSQDQTIGGSTTITSAGTYTVKADGGITLKTDGPMNMMASTWLMNAAGGQTNLDSFFLSIASKDMKKYNFLYRPNLININVCGIAAAAVGMRRDAVRKKYELAGVVLQNRGKSMQAGAVTRSTFAASFALGFITFL